MEVLDGIRSNLGRTLTAMGEVEEAMTYYKAIKNPDYFSQCGLALASLKGKYCLELSHLYYFWITSF